MLLASIVKCLLYCAIFFNQTSFLFIKYMKIAFELLTMDLDLSNKIHKIAFVLR